MDILDRYQEELERRRERQAKGKPLTTAVRSASLADEEQKVQHQITVIGCIRGRIGIIESGTRTVIGDVELTNCIYDHQFKHYGWEISNPRRYAKPVPFEHKQGCVTWAILDYDPDAQKIAPELPEDVFRSESRRYRKTVNNWLLEHTQRLLNGRAE